MYKYRHTTGFAPFIHTHAIMDDNNISYLVTNLWPISNSYYKGTFTCDKISNAPELKIKFNSYKGDFLFFIVNTHRSYDSPK